MIYGHQPFFHIGNGQINTFSSDLSVDDTCVDYIAYRNLKKSHVDSDVSNYSHYFNNSENLLKYQESFDSSYTDTPPVLFKADYSYSRTLSIHSLNSLYKSTYKQSFPTSFYPIATRYVTESGDYVIERPPFQIDLDYKIGRASSNTKRRLDNCKIWIPWTIFIFNPNSPTTFRYFFSSSSLTDFNHKYLAPYIPNTYASGDICFSNSLNYLPQDSLPDPSDISHFYAVVFNDFFSGGWNSDLANPWYTIISRLMQHHKDAAKSASLFISRFPLLSRIIHPSEELILQAFSKSKKIKDIYNHYYLPNKDNHFASPFYHLDQTALHHYLLTILSTFDLPDILALIDEVAGAFPDSQVSNPGYHESSYFTFSSIISGYKKSSIDLTTSIKKAIDKASTFESENSSFYSYNQFSTNILVINHPNLPHIISPRSSFQKSSFISSTLTTPSFTLISHKIINDKLSGKDTDNALYIYDYNYPNLVHRHILKSDVSDYYFNLATQNFHLSSILSENELVL